MRLVRIIGGGIDCIAGSDEIGEFENDFEKSRKIK